MSVYGVSNNPLLSSLGTIGRPGTAGAGQVRPGQSGGVQPGVARPAAAPAAPAAARPQQSLATPANALPAEAPAGTDPELWSVLTADERTYFAKAAASGPLTYGRVASRLNTMNGIQQAPPAARGVRLDVRA